MLGGIFGGSGGEGGADETGAGLGEDAAAAAWTDAVPRVDDEALFEKKPEFSQFRSEFVPSMSPPLAVSVEFGKFSSRMSPECPLSDGVRAKKRQAG